jgi:hypothetical protein
LLARKDKALLVKWDAVLILNFRLRTKRKYLAGTEAIDSQNKMLENSENYITSVLPRCSLSESLIKN